MNFYWGFWRQCELKDKRLVLFWVLLCLAVWSLSSYFTFLTFHYSFHPLSPVFKI